MARMTQRAALSISVVAALGASCVPAESRIASDRDTPEPSDAGYQAVGGLLTDAGQSGAGPKITTVVESGPPVGPDSALPSAEPVTPALAPSATNEAPSLNGTDTTPRAALDTAVAGSLEPPLQSGSFLLQDCPDITVRLFQEGTALFTMRDRLRPRRPGASTRPPPTLATAVGRTHRRIGGSFS